MTEPKTKPKASGPAPMETLLGGTAVTVQRLDGQVETVTVRQFHISEFSRFAEEASDEGTLICFYTGKPADWPATLTPAAWEMLVETGERVNAENLDFFSRWLARQKAWSERIARLAESPSPTLSPNSASTPG